MRFERLEPRLVLDGTLLQLVAESGTGLITAIRNNVSINEDGEIAFIGDTALGNVVFVAADGAVVPKRVSFPPSTRDYGNVAVINNSLTGEDQVAARELVPGSPATFLVRKWNSELAGTWTIVASTGSSLDPVYFDGFTATSMDINDRNEVVFAGLDARSAAVLKLRVRDERGGALDLDLGTYTSTTQLRPQLSNDTEVVYRSPTGSIVKTEPGTALLNRIAGAIDGFSGLGRAPGISDDGGAVAFAGADDSGPGVWVSLRKPGGDGSEADRQRVKIAGLPDELGEGLKLTTFGVDSRIGVGGERRADQEGRISKFYITFLANDPVSGAEALWSVELRASAVMGEGAALGHFDVTSISSPRRIAAVGETVMMEAGGAGVSRTITDLEIYDPVTDLGTVGFWASFSNGQSGVVRSLPPSPAIVNVVTHGFGRDFTFSHPHLGALTVPIFGPGFLDTWNGLENRLRNIPEPGSVLDGEVYTYVSNWDSSDGWIPAFFSFAVEQYLQTIGLESTARLARDHGNIQLIRARVFAELAARRIVSDLEANGTLQGPELSQTGEQIIHLVGHSRGAAVNARVAQILASKGYFIDQYTALDGYSVDWPAPSNFLADIDISGTLATIGDDVERKVNYLVSHPLDAIILDLLEPYTRTALGLYSLPPATFSDAFRNLYDGSGDWSAPLRVPAGFDVDRVITSGSGLPVAHFRDVALGFEGIAEVYAASAIRDPPHNYILDNYLGEHRSDSSFVPASAAGGASLALAIRANGFEDGGFEMLGEFQTRAAALDVEFDDPILNLWKTMVTDSTATLATLWSLTGDVRLVDVAGDYWAELTQTASTTLGQEILIGADVEALRFHLNVIAAESGQTLDVLFGETVLASMDLAAQGPLGTPLIVSIPMAQLAAQTGLLSFRMAGPATIPAVIRVDDLELTESAPNADFDGNFIVDGNDFLAWQRGLAANPSSATRADGDADGDQDVDGDDLMVWKAQFGMPMGGSAATNAAFVVAAGDLATNVGADEAVANAGLDFAAEIRGRGFLSLADFAGHRGASRLRPVQKGAVAVGTSMVFESWGQAVDADAAAAEQGEADRSDWRTADEHRSRPELDFATAWDGRLDDESFEAAFAEWL